MVRLSARELGATFVLTALLATGTVLTAGGKSPEVRLVEAPGLARMTDGARTVRIDVNSASVEELVLLPGIGPVRARAIVAHRNAHGPFVSVDSLRAVRGIGPATVERIRRRAKAGGG